MAITSSHQKVIGSENVREVKVAKHMGAVSDIPFQFNGEIMHRTVLQVLERQKAKSKYKKTSCNHSFAIP